MTKIALRNPHLVVVGCLVALVLGYVAMARIPVDLLPSFKTPAVQVLTLYPGMPAPVVGADITSRLERWTGQSNGIARQESRSLTGVSVVRDSQGADRSRGRVAASALRVHVRSRRLRRRGEDGVRGGGGAIISGAHRPELPALLLSSTSRGRRRAAGTGGEHRRA